MAFVGTVTAQREYHLEHEWAKIWINQNGSIDLLYDISITLDSGPSINYVYIGQPKRDFTIGMAMDQDSHTLVASDASSGSDYKVQVNLYEPLIAGQTVRFNLTTNVARMIYEDTQNPGNVGMTFIPTWWGEASMLDLQVQIVLPPGVTVDMVIATEELWNGTFPEDGRLSVFWQRENLLPNQRYTFGVSFPKEFIQEYISKIHILPDGNIDPPTANISTVDYVTYTFIGNIHYSFGIIVERDNIVVDGAGCTLQGTGSGVGIDLTGRSNVTIKNMKIKEFHDGIRLDKSSNNSISGNDLTANRIDGLQLINSSSNRIYGNIIANSHHGIKVGNSSNNIILENNITCNAFAVILSFSFDNLIYHDNFINSKTWQVLTFDSVNNWDNGIEGNYWSNYEEKYPDAKELDGSGIWNTPYVIDENNQDNYPLVNPTWGTAKDIPFWTQWWFWTILTVIIVASAWVVYLKKRKPQR